MTRFIKEDLDEYDINIRPYMYGLGVFWIIGGVKK